MLIEVAMWVGGGGFNAICRVVVGCLCELCEAAALYVLFY